MAPRNPSRPVRFMGKHPVFGGIRRTRDPANIRNEGLKATDTGVPYKLSPYYWWWYALRLSNKYQYACENDGKGMKRIYNDFGDVFHTDFKSWWRENGARLFGEPPAPMSVQTIQPEDVDDITNTVKEGQTMLLSIPLFMSKREILKSVRREVGKVHTAQRGRTSASARQDQTSAKYPLLPYNSIHAIEAMVRTYEKAKKNPNHRLSDLAIQETDLTPNISRRKRKSKTLIKYVEKGQFPVTVEPK